MPIILELAVCVCAQSVQSFQFVLSDMTFNFGAIDDVMIQKNCFIPASLMTDVEIAVKA